MTLRASIGESSGMKYASSSEIFIASSSVKSGAMLFVVDGMPWSVMFLFL